MFVASRKSAFKYDRNTEVRDESREERAKASQLEYLRFIIRDRKKDRTRNVHIEQRQLARLKTYPGNQ